MKKAKPKSFGEGEVLLLTNGVMVRILELQFLKDNSNVSLVQFIHHSTPTYQDLSDLYVQMNLGNSNEILTMFYSTRSIHLRLNQLKDI